MSTHLSILEGMDEYRRICSFDTDHNSGATGEKGYLHRTSVKFRGSFEGEALVGSVNDVQSSGVITMSIYLKKFKRLFSTFVLYIFLNCLK